MSFKVLSLFSGVGGFDLGLERAGMRVIGQVEIDPFCNRVLAEHWPNVRRYGDVRNIGLESDGRQGNRLPLVGPNADARRGRSVSCRVDLICGGFPCQDLSVAGKRAGLDGERSGLWFEFKRVLSELRPTWAIIENVPGLLSSSGGRDFGIVLSGLAECGFAGVGWRVLDSRYFGVAQRRRRVFIVGGPSRGSVAQVLSLCESCAGDSQAGRTAREDVAGSIGQRINRSRTELDGHGAYIALNGGGADAPQSRRIWDGEGQHPALDVTAQPYIAHSLRSDGFDASEDGTGRGTPLVSLRTAQTSSNGRGVDESDTAYTLDGANGQAVAGASVRRLTPTECERLQGFPDGWTALGGAADGPRYRALGNAVTVSVIEYLGSRILAVRP